MNPNGATAALKAFGHAMKKDTATPAQVLERAKICKTCPHRRKISGMRSQLSRFLGTVANHHKVPQDISKYKCGVCSCSFMLLVPAKVEDLHVDTPAEAAQRPDHCWVKKERSTR